MSAYRRELPPLPDRMRALPLDARGYPIPWFVAEVSPGVRDFRVMDSAKWKDALRFDLCWVCGQKRGRRATFVSGPMCGISRTSSEPPCHRECAVYSATACPFLTRPKMDRREGGLPEDIGPNGPGGIAIPRNPGVTLLWGSKDFYAWNAREAGGKGVLIDMGEPLQVDWLCEGRPATRAEVIASIDSGIPTLEAMADTDPRPGAREELARLRARLELHLPREAVT